MKSSCRRNCVSCNQGAEFSTNCTRRSVVYENAFFERNQGAGGKKELEDKEETSYKIQKRKLDHWGAYRRNSNMEGGRQQKL